MIDAAFQERLHIVASSFYQQALSYADIKIFIVGDYQVFAITQDDANKIYELATQPDQTDENTTNE